MRTLGDIRETLAISNFVSYVKVEERLVVVSQAKIFCSDALKHSNFVPLVPFFHFYVLGLWYCGSL